MAHIEFKNVTLELPIYGASQQSLKKKLVSLGTGGVISSGERVNKVVALNNISFTIRDGDKVGIVGHNGAGKTTLLRTMAGVFKPTFGDVSIQGNISTIIDLGAGFDSQLSGFENIYRMGLLLGHSISDIDLLIPDIQDFTELGGFLDLPVGTYSSGMLMRLMFAISIANKPEVFIVDEMFGTGDKSFQEKAKRKMEDLISNSKIFIFSSHSEELIAKFCNRVLSLNHGVLTEIV